MGRIDISVLYVEDEAVTRMRLVALLQREIASVYEAGDGREGLEQYRRFNPDVVVTDIRMPVLDGIAMAREIKRIDPDAEIIVTSAHNEVSLLLNAIETGVSGYLLKPVNAKELMAAINKASEKKQLEQALRRSERYFRGLVEHAADALLVFNRATGEIQHCNEQACLLLGYGRNEFATMNITDVEVFQNPDQFSVFCKGLEAGKPVTAESLLRCSDGRMVPVEANAGLLEQGEPLVILHIRDISERKLTELERESLITDLRKALSEIKTLRGIIPICSACKKIRDDGGYWKQVESYIHEHTDAEFTHGICPDCAVRLYPDFIK